MDFPHDFEPNNNLFRDALLSQANDSEQLNKNRITFIGCYPKITTFKKALLFLRSRISDSAMVDWLNHQKGLSSINRVNGKKVWITFENRRIPSEGVDLSLSFDLDSNGGKNLYFPLLFSYIDFLNNKASYVRHHVSFDELLSSRVSIGKNIQARKFACTFINNPDPVRLRFLRELSKYGEVEIFGRYTNNYVEDKVAMGNNYKFVICFENDLYPGYVTEKPLEAWLSKSVPVYWGNDAGGLLNSAALINCASYDSLAAAAELIASLQSQTEVIEELIKQPLLNPGTQKPDLVGFLKPLLG